MGKKNKPLSREIYEQNNPNWTVRMPLELHNVLNDFLEDSDLSRREFMAIGLGKQKANFERVRDESYSMGIIDGERNGYNRGKTDGYNTGWQQGYNDGQKKGNEEGHQKGYAEGLKRGKKEGYDEGAEYIYEKMKDQNKLWYYCAGCGEPIFIERNSPEHHFIIDMMRQNGWRHSDCGFWGDPYW